MPIEVKQDLKKIKKDRVGERFKNAHKRLQKRGASRGWVRVVFFALAALSAVIAVVLVVIPGPAFVFFILSAALLASQSWTMACLLDRAETVLRRVWATHTKNRPVRSKKKKPARRRSKARKDAGSR